MLKKLAKSLFGYSEANSDSPETPTETSIIDGLDLSAATVIQRNDHCISRKHISPNALKVLYRLEQAGYHAFLVGGGVRDLLLQSDPKDFDISTNATPEEIRQLFRNAMIIGRRFKIVHIRFGREIIEVTTFRAHHAAQNQFGESSTNRQIKGLDSAHSSTGMILRDNVYGDISEDALRRDFTINALYYTTRDFQVLDFANGMMDIEARQIRMIGDPETRYKEDPVRLLRAIRFAAKLDFEIAPETREPMDRLAFLLESISPARLFDETLKLFVGGKAEETFRVLRQFEVSHYLFPATMELMDNDSEPANRLLLLALRNTDARLAIGKKITPAFLYAALLWPPLQRILRVSSDASPNLTDLQAAASAVISEQLQSTSIPRRFTIAMREIWELQLRLAPRSRRSAETVFGHPRFRAAYDFLLLREEAGENLDGLGQWWTDYQNGDTKHREAMLQAITPRKKKKRRKNKSRQRKSPGNPE